MKYRFFPASVKLPALKDSMKYSISENVLNTRRFVKLVIGSSPGAEAPG